eukprot:GGOE01007455.1.p1 GENE.GGOE01007455.1~~GGOE01007455.1.p1  ORF type:complete len:1242 (+),score=371.87 GGOE01007455.1:275-3727(+)
MANTGQTSTLQTLALFCRDLDTLQRSANALGQGLELAEQKMATLQEAPETLNQLLNQQRVRPRRLAGSVLRLRHNWYWMVATGAVGMLSVMWSWLALVIPLHSGVVIAVFLALFVLHLADYGLGIWLGWRLRRLCFSDSLAFGFDTLALAILLVQMVLLLPDNRDSGTLLLVYQLAILIQTVAHTPRLVRAATGLGARPPTRRLRKCCIDFGEAFKAASSGLLLLLFVAPLLAVVLGWTWSGPQVDCIALTQRLLPLLLPSDSVDEDTLDLRSRVLSAVAQHFGSDLKGLSVGNSTLYQVLGQFPHTVQCFTDSFGAEVCLDRSTNLLAAIQAYAIFFVVVSIGVLQWFVGCSRAFAAALRPVEDVVETLMAVREKQQGAFCGMGETKPEQWIASTMALLRDLQAQAQLIGKHASLLRSIKNIHEIHRAEVTMKANFLMGMSHELRTPIAGLIGHAELLEEALADHPMRQSAHTIQLCGEALLHRVNGALQLAQLIESEVVLELTTFCLEELAEEAFTITDSELVAKKLKASLHVEPDLPTMVQGDAVKIRQTLVNLLQNAIRFTPHTGEICLCLRKATSEDAVMRYGNAAKLDTVLDLGPTVRSIEEVVSVIPNEPTLEISRVEDPHPFEFPGGPPSKQTGRWQRWRKAAASPRHGWVRHNSSRLLGEDSFRSHRAGENGTLAVPRMDAAGRCFDHLTVMSIGTCDASGVSGQPLSLSDSGSESLDVVFSVIDNGIGIPASKLGTVFEPFTQVDQGTTRKFEGCGLGLTLSKSLVEAMNGSIRIQSPATLPEQSISNVGTKVSFMVPMTPVATERVDPTRYHNCVVLIVVSNDRARLSLCTALSSAYIVWRLCSVQGLPTAVRSQAGRVAVILDEDDLTETTDFDLLAQLPPPTLLLLLTLGMRTATSVTCLPKPLSRRRLLQWLDKGLSLSPAPPPLPIAPRRRSAPMEGGWAPSPALLASRTPSRSSLPTSPLVSPPPVLPHPRPPTSLHPPPAAEELEVLVAEDNVMMASLMQLQLRQLGHRFHLCANGQEVLERLKTTWYPVILMDYHMPVMDGIECAKHIRRMEQEGFFGTLPPIRIVATTADCVTTTQQECLAAGMNAYLGKPLRRRDLQAVLHAAALPRTPEPLNERPQLSSRDSLLRLTSQ